MKQVQSSFLFGYFASLLFLLIKNLYKFIEDNK